ncbi:hypothetical protein OsI_23449 [Oryza sativa Indica Group]|uniref:Uncharacterized protein n=1 Tax=Oryza sativa subsp. indica TaxID=39946 RepID=B8B3V3_ORYSI|nr:hypothetical protein OsI_23449 [Oryza sativa Indica Group]
MDAPTHRLSTKMPDEGSAHLESKQTLAIRKMMDRTLNQVDELTLLFRGLNYRRISIVERQYTQRWFQSELIQILDV